VFDSRSGLGIFLFTTASRTALGPTQTPIQWVPRAISLGVKRPGREADNSASSTAEVKECVELYIHSSIRLHGVVLSKKKAQGQPYFLLATIFFIIHYICYMLRVLELSYFNLDVLFGSQFCHLSHVHNIPLNCCSFLWTIMYTLKQKMTNFFHNAWFSVLWDNKLCCRWKRLLQNELRSGLWLENSASQYCIV
jgi:hypothetical protein